jgi:hypothetical protein
MVHCDQCKRWFHLHCAGLSVVEARCLMTFLCSACRARGAQTRYKTTTMMEQEIQRLSK